MAPWWWIWFDFTQINGLLQSPTIPKISQRTRRRNFTDYEAVAVWTTDLAETPVTMQLSSGTQKWSLWNDLDVWIHGRRLSNARSLQSPRSGTTLSCQEVVGHTKSMFSAGTGLASLFCGLAAFIGIQPAGKTDGNGHRVSKAPWNATSRLWLCCYCGWWVQEWLGQPLLPRLLPEQ